MPKLPEYPDETESCYHIRGADNRVRVVLRNRYAHMGHDKLMNLRLEIRVKTGPESIVWETLPGTVTGLMCREEAEEKAAAWYHGGWRDAVAEAAKEPSKYATYLSAKAPRDTQTPWLDRDDDERFIVELENKESEAREFAVQLSRLDG